MAGTACAPPPHSSALAASTDAASDAAQPQGGLDVLPGCIPVGHHMHAPVMRVATRPARGCPAGNRIRRVCEFVAWAGPCCKLWQRGPAAWAAPGGAAGRHAPPSLWPACPASSPTPAPAGLRRWLSVRLTPCSKVHHAQDACVNTCICRSHTSTLHPDTLTGQMLTAGRYMWNA